VTTLSQAEGLWITEWQNNPVTASFHIWACCMYGWWRRRQDDSNSCPTRQLEETTRVSLHHVAEHRPAWSDSLQPHTERSSRLGPEPSSVRGWCLRMGYAVLVVHARKEEMPFLSPNQQCQTTEATFKALVPTSGLASSFLHLSLHCWSKGRQTPHADYAMPVQQHNNNHFTALCLGLPGWAGTRRNTHPPAILIITQSKK